MSFSAAQIQPIVRGLTVVTLGEAPSNWYTMASLPVYLRHYSLHNYQSILSEYYRIEIYVWNVETGHDIRFGALSLFVVSQSSSY